MLLRASSEAIGQEAKLDATVGRGDSGIPHGDLLAAYAEAATRGSPELAALRAELLDAVGEAAFVDAAATVAIFNGLVRVADATGIPLDAGTLDASSDFRDELGLNEFAGASSTDLAAARSVARSDEVSTLFMGKDRTQGDT
jgi:hypothetical protein